MLRRLDEIEGIVMCSLFMLPADPAKRRWIYDRFLESGAALHCVFEGLVIEDEDGVRRAEDLLRMNAALDVAPTRIDPALLPPLDEVDSFSYGVRQNRPTIAASAMTEQPNLRSDLVPRCAEQVGPASTPHTPH